MNRQEEAQKFLNELISCMPRSFYNNLDGTKRGVSFILSYLARADGEVIAGDFAKKLNVSTARVAALLKKMEQSGLITRRCSARDARRTVVEITPAGLAMLAKRREQYLLKVQQLLEQIGREDLRTFIRISQKIREVVEN